MATFTMELSEVIESLYNDSPDEDDWEQPYESVTFSGITYGKLPTLPDYVSIGLGTYPLFNESYRKVLNGKIIDEYFKREIGTETIDNFTLTLRKKMDQIMPYYNKLYESELIPYEALDSMRIHSVGSNTIEGTENVEQESNSSNNTTSGSRAVSSNFPQTMLAGNGDYATGAADSNSTSLVDGSADSASETISNTSGNTENLVTGYQGAASDLITKFRSTLLNIDTMILAEIQDCFMLVLNNGDEYFARDTYWRY